MENKYQDFARRLKFALKKHRDFDTRDEQDLLKIMEMWSTHLGKPILRDYESCVKIGMWLLRPQKVKPFENEKEQEKFYLKKRKKIARYDKWVKRHPPESKKTKMSL